MSGDLIGAAYTRELARQVASVQRRAAKLCRIFGAGFVDDLHAVGLELRPTERPKRKPAQARLPGVS